MTQTKIRLSGTDTATVTPTNGGGPGVFNSTIIGAPVYSAAVAPIGGGATALLTTANTAQYGNLNINVASTGVTISFDVYVPAGSIGGTHSYRIYDTAGRKMSVDINASGKFEVRQNTTLLGVASTASIPTDQWVRVQLFFGVGSGSQTVKARAYKGATVGAALTTLIEQWLNTTYTGFGAFTTTATVRNGESSTNAGAKRLANLFIDDAATDLPAAPIDFSLPANVGPTVYAADGTTPLASPTHDIRQLAGTTVNLDGWVKDTDGTVSSAVWEYIDDLADGTFNDAGTWTGLTTTQSGQNTANLHATASDTAVAGVRKYRLRGVDNSGASVNASIFGYIYQPTGTPPLVRAITGGTNAGTTPAVDAKTALNDAVPASWVESAAGPVAEVWTVLFDPVGPGDIKLPLDWDADSASPIVDVLCAVVAADLSTVRYSTTINPTTSVLTYEVKLDVSGNTNMTAADRNVPRLRVTSTTR